MPTGLEIEILATEAERPTVRYWHRNRAHPAQHSLTIAYQNGDQCCIVRPGLTSLGILPSSAQTVAGQGQRCSQKSAYYICCGIPTTNVVP